MKHFISFLNKMSMMQIILWHGRNLKYKRSDLAYLWINNHLYHWQYTFLAMWKRV